MAVRPEFREGDIVMICSHLFERARMGHDISWKVVSASGRFTPRQAFTRDDGTAGDCDFVVLCGRCRQSDPHEALLIEEVYKRGQFHVADHIRQIKTVKVGG